MPQDFKKKQKFWDIFLFLVPVKILSQYPNIDSTHWFCEDVEWSRDKIFR